MARPVSAALAVLLALCALAAGDSALRARTALREGERELARGRPALARAWLESAARQHAFPPTPWSRRARRLLSRREP